MIKRRVGLTYVEDPIIEYPRGHGGRRNSNSQLAIKMLQLDLDYDEPK
jgi:hypothetical protein